MGEVRGGTAVVTGASSGIGAAVAAALAGRGWRVVCAARRLDRLEALCRDLGAAALPLELDVTDAASVATLVERLPAEWRDVALLVNSAGHDIGGRRRFDRGAIDDWSATLQANALGTMRVTHALLPGMVARGSGHVVNVGSIAAREVNPGGAAYTASKFAVHGFSQALRADFKGKGVRVTEVLPGLTRTGFAEARWAGDRARADEFYRGFAQVMEPDDIARAVVFAIEQPPHVTVAEMVIVTSA